MISPCYNCIRRSSRCHAECDEYKLWSAENKRRRRESVTPYTSGSFTFHNSCLRRKVRIRTYPPVKGGKQ